MASWKVHIIFGIIFSAVAFYLLYMYYGILWGWEKIGLVLPIVVIYSILPDIDHPVSKIRSIVTIISLIFIIMCFIFKLWIWGIFIGIILLIIQFLIHRAFAHSILAGILLSLPLLYFSWIVALFGFVSFLSHCIIDIKIKIL